MLAGSTFSTRLSSRAWTAIGSSQTTASMVGALRSARTRVSMGAELEGMTLIVMPVAFENGSSTILVQFSCERPPFIIMLMVLGAEPPPEVGPLLAAWPPQAANIGMLARSVAPAWRNCLRDIDDISGLLLSWHILPQGSL